MAIASADCALLVHGTLTTCRACVRKMKHDNKPQTTLPVHVTCVLGLICAATLCSVFERHTLHDPVVEELAVIAGGAQDCGIKSTLNQVPQNTPYMMFVNLILGMKMYQILRSAHLLVCQSRHVM